jgi:hypothetical protein
MTNALTATEQTQAVEREAAVPGGERLSFQERVQPWMMVCFGKEIAADIRERNHRFLEEALELVQSTLCTQSEAHQLVDYVYSRPVGETHQEIGGVMVTLAALSLAIGQDMHAAGETELARIWTKVEKIRAKQAAKPKHSPLPEYPAHRPPQPGVVTEELREALTDPQFVSSPYANDGLHWMLAKPDALVAVYIPAKALRDIAYAQSAAASVTASPADGDVIEALRAAEKELTHEPEYCYATGPRTGDPIQDLVACPGCAALAKIRAALSRAGERT